MSYIIMHFFWKSIQSSAIDYFKSHLLAQHSMNEGESATDIEWYSFQNITIHKNYTQYNTHNINTCPSSE